MIQNLMKTAIIASLLTIVGSFALTSCYQKPGPGKAEITVVDRDGDAQRGVHVRLYCTEPGCDVERMGTTNSTGKYTQEFDLPAVLRVRAVRYDSTITVIGLPPNQREEIEVDSLCGEGFIQIENDETTNEVVTILQCK